MNKWHKRILIGCGLTFLVGAGLATLAWQAGGKTFFHQQWEAERMVSVTEDLEAFHQLDWQAEDLHVEILPSPDQGFHLEYVQPQLKSGQRKPVQISQQDGQLTLTSNPDFITLGHVGWTKQDGKKIQVSDKEDLFAALGIIRQSLIEGVSFQRVKLYVPEGHRLQQVKLTEGDHLIRKQVMDQLTLSTSLGDVTIEESQVANLALSVDLGEVTVKHSQIGQLDLTLDAGDVFVTGGQLGQGQIQLALGDYRSQATYYQGDLDLTVQAGDVSLTLPEAHARDLSYDLEASEIELASALSQFLQMSSDDDTSLLYEQAEAVGYLHLKALSGDIRLD